MPEFNEFGRTPQQQEIWESIIAPGGSVPLQPAEVDYISFVNGGGPHQHLYKTPQNGDMTGVIPYGGSEGPQDRAIPARQISKLWWEMPA
jgi:hypothetical protein